MKNIILIIVFIILNWIKANAQEPDFQIVFLNTYFDEYLATAKENNENLKSLYLDKVRLPIFKDHFAQSEYANFVFDDLAKPSLDLNYLKTTLQHQKENKRKIENISEKTLKKCHDLLYTKNLTIYIIPPSSELKEMVTAMNGVFGFTAGSQQIIISLDPAIKGWEKMLAYAIAHEYHHVVWTKLNFYTLTKWTLLDYMIFEGKADCFAKQLYPKVKTPWTEALAKDEKEELWQQLQTSLNNQDFGFQAEVMFGTNTYPLWGGYTLGFDIVNDVLKKQKKETPNDWINNSSESMLEKSRYANK